MQNQYNTTIFDNKTTTIMITKNYLLFGMLFLFINCNTCQNDHESSAHLKCSQQEEIKKEQQGKLTFNQLLLKASQEMAADLSASSKLVSNYQNLQSKITVQQGNNLNASFVGIEAMKKALRNQDGAGNGNLNKFINWAQAGTWEQFGPNYHHYDWWMFPIDKSSQGYGFQYTVYQDDIQQLKEDRDWLKDYRLGAILLMQSWGWDVKNKKKYEVTMPGQQWRNWDVRLGKLIHSLILFQQWDLYDSLKQYVTYLNQSGVTLQNWIFNYM